MTVFKTIFKIMWKEKFQIILYTSIILLLCILNQTSNQQNPGTFIDSKTDLLIVNKYEEDEITKGFTDFMKDHANIKKIDLNDEEAIDDALFYREVNYVIYIPKDFSEKIVNGETPTMEYKTTGDINSTFAEMLINKYIKTLAIYGPYYNKTELINKVNETLNNNIDIKLKTKLDTEQITIATSYFNFTNYAVIIVGVYVTVIVLADMKKETIAKRNNISSYKPSKLNKDLLIANGIFMILLWVLYFIIIGFAFYKDIMLSKNGLAFMANGLIFTFNSLTLGLLIGNITTNKEALGGLLNVLGLGTSFLCGCFVPLEYLPDIVAKIGKIFPSYWFISNNNLIGVTEEFNSKFFCEFGTNGLIMLAYSIIFIIGTNIISKKHMKIA